MHMLKYLVYGNEPYLIDKFRKEIISTVATPEFNLMDTDEFTEEVQQFIDQYPIFEERKILIFRVNVLKECADLLEYVSNKSKANIYIFCKNVDKRSKLFKIFKSEEIKIYDKLSRERLEQSVMQYIKKAQCEITTEAYKRYLELTNYYSDDANLYDVHHSLERLCATKKITREVVEQIVTNNETENIYVLIQLILEKKYVEMFHQADLIVKNQSQNIIGILSLLLRSYRIAYKMKVGGCSLQELGITSRTLVPPLSGNMCHKAMNVIDEAVNGIKRGRYKPDMILKVTLAKLCHLEET